MSMTLPWPMPLTLTFSGRVPITCCGSGRCRWCDERHVASSVAVTEVTAVVRFHYPARDTAVIRGRPEMTGIGNDITSNMYM